MYKRDRYYHDSIIALSFIRSILNRLLFSPTDFIEIITGSARKIFVLTIPSCSRRTERDFRSRARFGS